MGKLAANTTFLDKLETLGALALVGTFLRAAAASGVAPPVMSATGLMEAARRLPSHRRPGPRRNVEIAARPRKRHD